MKKIVLLILAIILCTAVGCTCNVSEGNVYYDCNGSLLPCTNLTYNLGSPLAVWHNLYVENIIGWAPVMGSNVTSIGGATVPYSQVPYFTAPRNIEESNMFWDNATDRLGINTNAPVNELDVVGTIHSTGDIVNDSDINAGNDIDVPNDLTVDDNTDIGGTLSLYDDALITTNAIIPQDLTITTGANQTLVLTTPVYEDMRTPVNAIKVSGTRPPTWTSYKSGEVLAFSDQAIAGNEEEVFFQLQLPHSYKEGTNVEVHVHFAFSTNTTQVVRWGLDYAWANMDALIPASTAIYKNFTGVNDADYHRFASFGYITGTGKLISSMLVCRLFRNSSNVADTYTNSVYLLEVDSHYQVNTMGSRQELIK